MSSQQSITSLPLSLCTWNECVLCVLLFICHYLFVFLCVCWGVCLCTYLSTYLCGLVVMCPVCLCVQWGEDGCSFSSYRAGWTGWLCQPPRSTGSTSKQRKWAHTRKEVMRDKREKNDVRIVIAIGTQIKPAPDCHNELHDVLLLLRTIIICCVGVWWCETSTVHSLKWCSYFHWTVNCPKSKISTHSNLFLIFYILIDFKCN